MYRLYEEHPNGIKLLLAKFETEQEAEQAYDTAFAAHPELNYVVFKTRFARIGWWKWQ